METIPLIVNPLIAPWVPWVLLAIGISLLWTFPHIISSVKQFIQALTSYSLRHYGSGRIRSLSRLGHIMILSSELALLIQIWLYDGQSFTLANYLRLIAILTPVLVLQQIATRWVCWTFLSPALCHHFLELRTILFNVIAPLLYVILIITAQLYNNTLALVCIISVILFWIITLFWQGLRFAHNYHLLLHLFLYTAFAQVLPFVQVFKYCKYVFA